jgi:hypothetical protein
VLARSRRSGGLVEDDISIIVKAAQDTARRMKDPGIAAPFEETIQYNGQIAEKATQTRRKERRGQGRGHPGRRRQPGRAAPAGIRADLR